VTYRPFGPLASLAYGNGLALARTFTQDYLLGGLTVQDPATLAIVLSRSLSRTDNVNLTGITDNADSTRSESYAYTPANRLQTAGGLYGSLTYSYDGVGNRTQEVVGSTTNAYNYPSNSNLLSSVTQGGTTVRGFTADGAGNVITDNRGGPTYTYGYNNRGRLAQAALGSTVVANYTYDGLERMAIRTTQNVSSPGTTNYVYDRAGWLLAEASASGTTQTEYVWLDDLPLAVFAGVDTGSPTLFYVHADHLNRPVRMTDVNENLVWDAIYWPFGAVYLITGSAADNMRFPGQYYLLESGLHYNWHRHYDPTLGRYLQADPLATVFHDSLPLSADGISTGLSSISLPANVLARPASHEETAQNISYALQGPSSLSRGPESKSGYPSGFSDGPSLYGYVGQSPLIKADPKGLLAAGPYTPTPATSRKTQLCQQVIKICLLVGEGHAIFDDGSFPRTTCTYEHDDGTRVIVHYLGYKVCPAFVPC
jgi:RHS repeat-associated protein